MCYKAHCHYSEKNPSWESMQTLIILSSEQNLNAVQEIWYDIKKWWENKIWNILSYAYQCPFNTENKARGLPLESDAILQVFLMKRLKDVVKVEWAVLIPVLQKF